MKHWKILNVFFAKGGDILIREITLGQYIPGKSIIHKLDPRTKIILTFALIILTFICENFLSLVSLFCFVLLVLKFTKIHFKMYFKSMKMILAIVIFTAGLNIFYGTGEAIFQLGFVSITRQGINNSIFIAVRILSLVLLSSVLTFTTSPTDLTDGIERLLSPLNKLHLNVHEFAMMLTIALRFVPTLLEETDKIMNAQKARGADLESGGFIQRIKALIPILIPLFISSFRRAYDLAIAMECRCYSGGDGRTRMKVLRMTTLDYVSFLATAFLLLLIILLNIFVPAVTH